MENFVLYEEMCVVDGQKIYKARRKGTISFLAISCIEKKRRTFVTNHVRFAHRFDHENILKFYEWYETSNHLWVVMDLCTGGTLEKMLREDKIFPEPAIVDIGRQLVYGLQFIQATGVVFADWFPGRIFLHGGGKVKYFDFSYARMEQESAVSIFGSDNNDGTQFVGLSSLSLPYISPEILNGAPASKASDVWGLGCILFRMFFGVYPFSSQVPSHLLDMICNREIEMPIQCDRKPSKDLWNLLCSMLSKDPIKRITLKGVAKHRFWQISPPTENALCRRPLDEDGVSISNSASSVLTAVQTVQTPNGTVKTRLRNQPVTEKASKVIKRSVSLGDACLDSETLLHIKNPTGQTLLNPKKTTQKNAIDSLFESSPKADSTVKYDIPIGEANFTLHAQTCSVTMRRDATKIGGSTGSNDDSTETSYKRNSKLSSPSDSQQTTFYESHDNLHSQLSLIPDERMTRSELVFGKSDSAGQHGNAKINRSHLSAQVIALISPQTRAKIALLYPWGDDSSIFPGETRLLKNKPVHEWGELFTSDEINESDDFIKIESKNDLKQRRNLSCCPRPLCEYDKWTCNPPKPDINLSENISTLSQTTLKSLSVDQISVHADALLNLILNPATFQDTKMRLSDYLGYTAWFLASTTLTHTKGDSKKSTFEHNFCCSLFRIKRFLTDASALLKSNTIPVGVRMWICRITALLSHRISYMIQYYGEAPKHQSLIHTLVTEIAPVLSYILFSIVDILREPASKSVVSLKQAGITALGELLICELCIFRQVLSNPTNFGNLTLDGFDASRQQWQSTVLQLIRPLAPVTARIGSGSQMQPTTKTIFCTTPVKGHERGDSTVSASGGSVSVQLTEEHVRFAAARALDEVVIVVIGCKLTTVLQRLDIQELDRAHPGVQLAISLSNSVSNFLDCLLTPENISRVWADGVMGGTGDNKTSAHQKSVVSQLVTQASASVLAGLIRLRPSLFMGGVIDRNRTTSFMQKFRPATGARDGQSTVFMASLLSATATGLLLPLSFRGKPFGSSSLRIGLKSGTPAACRRLLTNPSFISALMRQLESPHVMLRAKAYLLVASALDCSSTSFSDTLVTSCEARLPSCLERDLRMTNQQYIPKTALEEDGILISIDERTEEEEIASGQQNELPNSMPPGLQYLGICVKHLADLMVHRLIPDICKHVAISIGAQPGHAERTGAKAPPESAQLHQKMTLSTYQERPKRTVFSADPVRRSPLGLRGQQQSNSTATGVSLKTWLPAFSCLPSILALSSSVRNSLLLPSIDEFAPEYEGRFCLIVFIAEVLEHWASAVGSISGVNQPGSLEHQLLGVTLTLTEDMSQQLDILEGRRADLIKCLLPALARLAVAPASDSITRAICVKIILDMKNFWCGGSDEYDPMTSSSMSLNLPKSPAGRKLTISRSPLSGDRLNLSNSSSTASRNADVSRAASLRGGENKRPSISRSSSRASSNRNSAYIKTSGAVSSLRGYKVTPTSKGGVQAPAPEVLLAVVDIVNTLLIPYASPLLDPRDSSPSAYFLRLLLDCLQPPSQNHSHDCSLPSVNNHPLTFFKAWRASNISSDLIRLLASCDSGTRRFSAHCLLTLRLLSIVYSKWPQESDLLSILLDSSKESGTNLGNVVSMVVVSLGGHILRRSRRNSEISTLYSSRTVVRSATPTASAGRPILLKISSDTLGVKHLLAALDLLNAVLNLIADVVRYALRCRQGKLEDHPPPPSTASRSRKKTDVTNQLPNNKEDICSVAEQLLSSARPPNYLPGILASLLEASSSDHLDNDSVRSDGDPNDDEVLNQDYSTAAHLVTLSTNALASLASLYGGEYCRTALSAAGLRGFSIAIRRHRQRSETRLLLRILRRLSESDEMCSRRMTGPAANHLQSAIWKLHSTDNHTSDSDSQDAATIRLAGVLLGRLHTNSGALLI